MACSTYLKVFLTWNAMCICGSITLGGYLVGSITGPFIMYQSEPYKPVTVRLLMDKQLPILFYGISFTQVSVDITKANKCFTSKRYCCKFTLLWESPRHNTFQLPGKNVDLDHLVGQVFVIESKPFTACGNLFKDCRLPAFGPLPKILHHEPLARLHVKMHDKKVSGDVWLRQAGPKDGAVITADLFNPGQRSRKRSIKWKIYSGVLATCRSLQPTALYEPKSAQGCIAGCVSVGNALGTVVIGPKRGSEKATYQSSNTPLSGANSVKGKLLVFFEGVNDSIIACGEIRETVRKATAYFSREGVIGSISFEQASPFDPTIVTVRLFMKRQKHTSFHVNEYPVPMQVFAIDELCSLNSIGEQYNPFPNDHIAVGDLSGKFGFLVGHHSYNIRFIDYNLPMFGIHSIIGRSVLLKTRRVDEEFKHKPSYWVCANILEKKVTVAIATFNSPIIGHVMFSQSAENPDSDTWIYGQLDFGDETMNGTIGNKWQINSNPVGDDQMSTDSDQCMSTGTTYNPFNVSLSLKNYMADCKPSNGLRCCVGDLFAQTGYFSIRWIKGTRAKTLFNAGNVPLSGVGNIVGRSLVIFDGSRILACADIVQLRARQARKNKSIVFSQIYRLIENVVTISFNLTNIHRLGEYKGYLAKSFYVYTLPVDGKSNNTCSVQEYSGTFNPYRDKIGGYSAKSNDVYAVGDLSRKNGYRPSIYHWIFFRRRLDSTLHLFGVNSIIGRSFVVQHFKPSSSWTCGNIEEDVSVTTGRMIKAIVTLSHSAHGFIGSIIFTQYVYPDGSMSDTSVYSDLDYEDAKPKVQNHNGIVHKLYIGSYQAIGDRNASLSEKIDSVGQSFNPYNVTVKEGYSDCGKANQLRCTVGDISGKIGPFHIDRKKRFEVDTNLPLTGKYSVIGLSFVIWQDLRTPLACERIRPQTAEKVTIETIELKDTSLIEIRNAYAANLQTDNWNIAVFSTNEKRFGSIYIDVYFMGPYASTLRKRFEAMIAASKMDKVRIPDHKAIADKVAVSVRMLPLVIICKVLLV